VIGTEIVLNRLLELDAEERIVYRRIE